MTLSQPVHTLSDRDGLSTVTTTLSLADFDTKTVQTGEQMELLGRNPCNLSPTGAFLIIHKSEWHPERHD